MGQQSTVPFGAPSLCALKLLSAGALAVLALRQRPQDVGVLACRRCPARAEPWGCHPRRWRPRSCTCKGEAALRMVHCMGNFNGGIGHMLGCVAHASMAAGLPT